MDSESKRFSRNKGIIPQEKLDEITVVGLGGIGSAFITLAAVMGFRRILGYDPDTLQEHNLSTTLYHQEHLGLDKADAAALTATAFGCPSPDMQPDYFIAGSDITPKAVVCTDTMESRMVVFKEWLKRHEHNPDGFFVDIRMGALTCEVVFPRTRPLFTRYNEFWYPSDEVEDAPCTEKHTIFTGAIAAGHALAQIQRWLIGAPTFEHSKHAMDAVITSTEGQFLDISTFGEEEKDPFEDE